MALLQQPTSHRNPFAEQIGDALAPAGHTSPPSSTSRTSSASNGRSSNPTKRRLVDLACFLFGFRDAQGKPHRVASKQMRISGNEKAALFGFLKSLLGRAPDYGWDYCSLKGHPCLLTVEHVQKRDGSGVFASIASLSPIPAGMATAPAIQQPAAPRPVAPRARHCPSAANRHRLMKRTTSIPSEPLPTRRARSDPSPSTTPTSIMAILTKNKAPASHWYQEDGTPVHRMPDARRFGERPTTLRDAKRLGLYPSVTSILTASWPAEARAMETRPGRPGDAANTQATR